MTIARLKKRELAAYLLLVDYGESINLGEAIDFLSENLCVTKRTAHNIIKRLRKNNLINYIIKDKNIYLSIKPIKQAFEEFLNNYVSQRRKRCYALAKKRPRS